MALPIIDNGDLDSVATQKINALITSINDMTSTTTTTTTTAAPGLFAGTIDIFAAPGICINPVTDTFSVTGDASTFCACTQLSSAGFLTLAAGLYGVKFGLDYVNVTTDGSSVAIINTGIGCYTCA